MNLLVSGSAVARQPIAADDGESEGGGSGEMRVIQRQSNLSANFLFPLLRRRFQASQPLASIHA